MQHKFLIEDVGFFLKGFILKGLGAWGYCHIRPIYRLHCIFSTVKGMIFQLFCLGELGMEIREIRPLVGYHSPLN